MTDSATPGSASAAPGLLRGLPTVRQLRPDALPEGVLRDVLEVAAVGQRWQSLALGICRTARSRYAASTLITGWASDRADRHTPG